MDLRNDFSACDRLKVKSVTQLLCVMYEAYTNVSIVALRVFVSFASTYLCEAIFSTLDHIKTKNRNILDVRDHMRLALTDNRPRILKLTDQMQHQAFL